MGKRLPEDKFRNPKAYRISIFGTPSDKEPWGWRFEGHHISLHFSAADGKLIGLTPEFLGANPGKVLEGEHKDLQVFKLEEDLGRQFLLDLEADQQKKAIISDKTYGEIVSGTFKDVRLDKSKFEGMPVSEMNDSQKVPDAPHSGVSEQYGNTRSR
ncbi:MAG: DUF3500 domain-containing protein [Bacteroidia bacterium]|nr:DUF3500 domain-containing protein [Bacteroidia bacterium]